VTKGGRSPTKVANLANGKAPLGAVFWRSQPAG